MKFTEFSAEEEGSKESDCWSRREDESQLSSYQKTNPTQKPTSPVMRQSPFLAIIYINCTISPVENKNISRVWEPNSSSHFHPEASLSPKASGIRLRLCLIRLWLNTAQQWLSPMKHQFLFESHNFWMRLDL